MNQEHIFDRIEKAFILGLGAAFICATVNIAVADTGWEGAIRQEDGSYAETRSVNLTTTTGTALWAASVSRPTSICRNNSAYTIWIGTTSTTIDGVAHSNITLGFPVLSSGTISLNSFTGALRATADTAAGAAGANMRCLDGLVR